MMYGDLIINKVEVSNDQKEWIIKKFETQKEFENIQKEYRYFKVIVDSIQADIIIKF
ncbi:unnamed protein product [marine sediment metagenome]|uniref:Uncharacterized protein n=1 Tax=marine sediment metagenome TaxID=412755 RepID=X1BE46_9ZZZZ